MPITAQQILAQNNAMSAIIIFNNKMRATTLTNLCGTHCNCIELSTGSGRWILINQYYQFADSIEEHTTKTREIVQKYSNEPLIITADVNAKSVLWHNNITDEKGELLELFLAETGLEVVNKSNNPPTYQGRARAQTNIDITFANNKIYDRISEWKVLEGKTVSDHNLIIMTIRGSLDTNSTPNANRALKYNIRKTNWPLAKAAYNGMEPVTGDTPDGLAKSLSEKFKRALDTAVPKITPKLSISNKPWTGELTVLRKRARRLRKMYQSSITDEERAMRLAAYRDAKETYARRLFELKMRSWEEFVEEKLKTDAWGIPYKIVANKIRSPTVLSTLRRQDGLYTNNWRESVDLLMQTLLPSDNPETEELEQKEMRSKMIAPYAREADLVPPLTQEEVRAAIYKLKKKKAPGPDGIQAEALHNLIACAIPDLCKVYEACLKEGKFTKIWKRADVIILKKGDDKDPTKPKSYRPICLLDNLGKVLERIICSRLATHREATGLNPNQYGFRKGKSTEDAINQVIRIANEARARYVIALFIDISGAFNNLWWPTLFGELRDMNCPK
jgi:hypothetical protein